MGFKIGFTADTGSTSPEHELYTGATAERTPRKSVVRVHFEERDLTLSYYNDRFDLKVGDLVYVEGKLDGVRGRVVEVSCSFKIKLSDYKRVIALADTEVHGKFSMCGSHFVTFERDVIPKEKITAWFCAPTDSEDEFVKSTDENDGFPLSNLAQMGISEATAKKGHEYYMDNKVRYVCLDGTRGYAIVEGGKGYELEFEYRDGEIKGLVCSCFCAAKCKHGLAAMLQLRETLDIIEESYIEQYSRTGYFAAISKGVLFHFAVDKKETGSFIL